MLQALAGTHITAHCRDIDIPEAAYAGLVTEYDIVIFPPAFPQRTAGVVTRRLLSEPLDIALPVSHHLAVHAALSPADVVDEDWIALPDGYPFDAVLDGIEAATGRTTRVVQRILDNRVTETLVAAGHGIALLPRYTARNDRIDLRPLTGIPAARYITAVARPDRAERGAVAHTRDALTGIARAVAETVRSPA